MTESYAIGVIGEYYFRSRLTEFSVLMQKTAELTNKLK